MCRIRRIRRGLAYLVTEHYLTQERPSNHKRRGVSEFVAVSFGSSEIVLDTPNLRRPGVPSRASSHCGGAAESVQRGTGARGHRSVVNEVLEGVPFYVESGVRFVITDSTARSGEAVKQTMAQTRARLSARLRWRVGVTRSSKSLPCKDLVFQSELGRIGLTPMTYFVL